MNGEAVASGVMLDSIYAQKKAWITAGELAAIRDGLMRSGFQLWFDELGQRDARGERTIFGGLRDFSYTALQLAPMMVLWIALMAHHLATTSIEPVAAAGTA